MGGQVEYTWNELARPRRFERPTFAFGGRHSIQLSYGRVVVKYTPAGSRPFMHPEWIAILDFLVGGGRQPL